MTRSSPLPVGGSIVLAVAALLLWAGTGRAFAHTDLEVSVPAAEEVVTTPLRTVELTFSSEVQPDFAQVAVTGPDGESSAAGPVTVEGRVVRPAVDVRTAGDYVVAYRIVSTDGHPVDGQYRFTYRGDGAAEAEDGSTATDTAARSPTAAPTAIPPATARKAGAPPSLWFGVIGGAAAAVAGAVPVLIRRRRRIDV